jgi:hypothetical protein
MAGTAKVPMSRVENAMRDSLNKRMSALSARQPKAVGPLSTSKKTALKRLGFSAA